MEENNKKAQARLTWCPLRGNVCMKAGCAWWVGRHEACAVRCLVDLACKRGG